MSLGWNDLGDELYFHSLHFNCGVSKKFDDLCKESVDFIFDRLSKKDKENMLKSYLFEDMRERSSPKELFLFLENNYGEDGKNLIKKYDLNPEDFIN
jgi:hypothetical protein